MRAIPLPITVEELHDLVHVEKLTDQQIADRLGSTKKRVQNWRLRFKIPSLPRWMRTEVKPIKGRLQSLLVGSMLGDGRVVHRTHCSHYTESHSGNQRKYLEWKEKIWGSWSRGISEVPDKRGFPQVRLRTSAHPDLNEWRDLFYESRDKGWKIVRPEVVELVDPMAMAIWYLDDGCNQWWPTITFGAGDESLEVAHQILAKFGLTARWVVTKGKTGNLIIEGEENAEKFIELIQRHVPACMKYKLKFGFQGSHYQVRKKIPVELLRELCEQGVPIRRIARELGASGTTVRRHIAKHGISHPRKVGRPPSR